MLLYLDTNIFLSLIMDETDAPEYQRGVTEIGRWIDSQTHQAATSVITLTEVLQGKTGQGAYERFLIFLEQIETFPVDRQIAKRAAILRDDALQADLTLKTPDALHIATAVYCGADYLCTKDEGILRFSEEILQLSDGQTKIIKPPIPGVQTGLLDS